MSDNDTTIPPEVVEAAAMQLPGMAGFPHLVEAAIRAAINTWPGVIHNGHWLLFPHTKLPLPATEAK